MNGNKKILNKKASDLDVKGTSLDSDLKHKEEEKCEDCMWYLSPFGTTKSHCMKVREPETEKTRSGKCDQWRTGYTEEELNAPKVNDAAKAFRIRKADVKKPTPEPGVAEYWSKAKRLAKRGHHISKDDHFKTLREDIIQVGVMEAYNPPKEPLKRKRCPIRIVLKNGAKAQCKETFERDCDLVQHLRDAHNTTKAEIYKALLAPKKMFCPYTNDLTMITKRNCKEPIKNTSELYRHCALYHRKDKERMDDILKNMGLKAEELKECPIEIQVTDIVVCAKQFETKRAARAHMMRVHKRTAEEVEKKMKRYKLKEA